MGDWPPLPTFLQDVTITPNSFTSIGSGAGSLGAQSSGTWPTANKALYVPFRIGKPHLVKKMWLENGATASGNLDLGIYSRTGVRLVSTGSTAQGSTSTKQEFDVTDTWLGAGQFYLALAFDSNTATVLRQTSLQTPEALMVGMAEQTSAFPLPAQATFQTMVMSIIPAFGAAMKTVI